jgi:hypothetical protein
MANGGNRMPRRGAGWQAQMAEDLDDTGGSSMPVQRLEGAAMIFKALPQFGQRSMSMSKTRLSKCDQLIRGDALCA